MSEKTREQTATMHFRRKSSDRMSEKSQQMSVRGRTMAKMALLSEEFRQDVREMGRKNNSQRAKMTLLSEGFRQDVRKAPRTD